MVCPNCTNNFIGHYCNECGQKSTDTKYTLKGMLSDLFLSALHVEKKGLPYTLRELTLRPGISIKKVIAGQRLYLYPPFKFLILMGAMVIVASLRYKFFHNEYTQLDNKDMDSFLAGFLISEHLTYLEGFFRFAEDEATILNIATIPVFAFVSWSFLTFRKYNFAENLIINTFITAQQLFFLLTLIPFIELFPQWKGQIIFFYSTSIIIYNIFVYVQLMEGNKFWLVFRAALVVLIAFLYQVPVNLLIYLSYDKVHKYFHWVSDVV
jgi:hypothetical protein